jgi:branched-chain amino acid transport system permease protein
LDLIGLSDLGQEAVTGLLTGGFFALASVGLSLIFGVQRILNVAHGAFIVLAAFVTIQFSLIVTPLLHLDPLVSLAADFLILSALGLGIYFLMIYWTENSGFEAPLLATFGLSVFLEYVIQSGLGPIRSIDPSAGRGAQAQNQAYTLTSLQVGSIYIPEPIFIAFILAIVIIPLMHVFLTRTYFGKTIRATSQDAVAAEFSGIDITRTRMLSFALGSGLAGVAGGIFAFTNSVTPFLGDSYLLPIILVVIVIGGVGSMLGTLVGGFVVGLLFSFSDLLAYSYLTQYGIQPDIGNFLTFLIFLIVLMIRPNGLMGKGVAG